jgi:hypothetical protein
MPSKTTLIQRLDARSRMFLYSLCLTEADVAHIGVAPGHTHVCVAPHTAALCALQRASADDTDLAERITAVLDLRHFECVLRVRSLGFAEAAAAARAHASRSSGEELAGWAWALVTDPRPEFEIIGHRLMADVFVRSLQTLGRPAPQPAGS